VNSDKGFGINMAFFDLNLKTPGHHTSGLPQKEMAHELGKDRLCSACGCGHRKEALEAGPEPLHNSTDSERYFIRENAHFTGILSCGIGNMRGGYG
jgi:hypothetical protein